jgi:hypothetical protein
MKNLIIIYLLFFLFACQSGNRPKDFGLEMDYLECYLTNEVAACEVKPKKEENQLLVIKFKVKNIATQLKNLPFSLVMIKRNGIFYTLEYALIIPREVPEWNTTEPIMPLTSREQHYIYEIPKDIKDEIYVIPCFTIEYNISQKGVNAKDVDLENSYHISLGKASDIPKK